MILIEFASIFVETARKNARGRSSLSEGIFSNRQAQAITALGICRMFRTGDQLSNDDLVSLAVLTSPPDAKKYAELIAFHILIGDESLAFETNLIDDVIDPNEGIEFKQPLESQFPTTKLQVQENKANLSQLLDFLISNISKKQQEANSGFDFIDKLENTLFSVDKAQELTEVQRMERLKQLTAYEVVGGQEGIISQNISNWDQMFDRAEKMLWKSIPSMSSRNLAQAKILDYCETVQKSSREMFIKLMAELLELVTKKWTADLEKVIDKVVNQFTVSQLPTALNYLQEYEYLLLRSGLPVDHYSALTYAKLRINEIIKNNAVTLDDILQTPGCFHDHFNHGEWDNVLEHSMNNSNPLETLLKAHTVDNLLGTNLVPRVYDINLPLFENMELEDWLENIIPASEWLEGFESKYNDYNESNPGWEERKSITEQINNVRANSESFFAEEILTRSIQEQINELIESSKTSEHLIDSVDLLNEVNVPLNVQQIKKKGKMLGMSPADIAKLVGDVYDYVRDLIENANPSFERVNSLIEKAHLTCSQINELTQIAFQEQSVGGLGALAVKDMNSVIKSLPSTQKAANILSQALGAGGGENLLYEWFKNSHSIPHPFRQVVKDHAKLIMIDLAKAKASALVGSSEAGPLPDGTTRPYFIGDDPDTIDIDETLDNILITGKQIDQITWDDIIVRKTVTGRRCVVFLIDISGSMQGEPLGCCSLATAMLLSAFARDELGVALFESNSHIICEIDKEIEIDDVIDEILDLQARGGTQMQAGLAWAEEQLKLSHSKDKMFIMATDAMIGDFNACTKYFRNIADQEVTSVLIIPASAYGTGNIQNIVENANAQLITIKNWKKFPELVSKILSRV